MTQRMLLDNFAPFQIVGSPDHVTMEPVQWHLTCAAARFMNAGSVAQTTCIRSRSGHPSVFRSTEVGFACAHKWQREHLLRGSFTDEWQKSTFMAEADGCIPGDASSQGSP